MYLLLSYVLCFVLPVHGAVQSNLNRLYTNLTTGYEKHVLPTQDHNTAVQVTMVFNMGSILEFVEKDGRFSVTGTPTFSWYDYQITWNPADYGYIAATVLPVSKIWVPPVQLSNAYNDYGDIERDWMKVKYYLGHAIWYPTLQFDVACEADVTYYPFDSHTCFLYFTTNTYNSKEINITLTSEALNMDYFQESLVWDFDKENSKVSVVDMAFDIRIITVAMSFKRRPAFYITNLIVPTCLIGILNNMVFVLPAESGERVGFSVTLLLAMAVFQTIVSDSLPTAALPSIPRLCYFLLADLIIGTFITVCTMFVLRFYFKKETDIVPGCLQTLVSCVFCKRSKHQVEDEEKSVTVNVSWQDVGQFFDMVLFCFFLLAILIKNVVLLAMLTTERKYVEPTGIFQS